MRRAGAVLVQLALWSMLGACGFVILVPHWAPARWLSTRLGGAQLIAFPYLMAAGGLVCGLVLLLQALVRRRTTFRILEAIAGVIAVALATVLAVVPVPAPARGSLPAPPPDAASELTVVTLNSQNTLSAAGFQALVAAADPDIVVLPEAERSRVDAAVQGSEFEQAFIDPAPEHSARGPAATQVLVHPRLGSVAPAEVPSFDLESKAATITPPTGQSFHVAGVHPVPPVPFLMERWRQQTQAFIRYGETHPGPVLLAGDFNATLRHGPLTQRQRLIAASEVCGRNAVGTWPAQVPFGSTWQSHPLRTPIDHIFVSPEFHVRGCSTMAVGNADHLAFIVRLSRS
ncbi:endonuclease/exonuclease/phosphatase family protein [Corynebacterium sp. TAE3-ERU30]|uniref:endonuclease/exonuclease/phosphatase family protein n=1 Tax=Corynebacterium sp. TAE3-ERU30 TaxID=2849496 RepID=UPI001C43F9E4|nr:endonuclease/exonuclease/phosphatase family protein [Corynebacterium sp. TAE3-ERU30]